VEAPPGEEPEAGSVVGATPQARSVSVTKVEAGTKPAEAGTVAVVVVVVVVVVVAASKPLRSCRAVIEQNGAAMMPQFCVG